MGIVRKPTLPPKAGYVEVEVDGVRQYKQVPTEAECKLEALERENAALQETLLQTQLALAELAEAQEGKDMENKLAIAELAEAVLGGEA